MEKSFYVGVIGSGTCPDAIAGIARKVGFEIGKRGWVLVCGGLGGVMEETARGCSEAGGMSVGILPGLKKEAANPYIQMPIATGLGQGRNLLVVRASDILIAISGGYGTLSEIALALKMDKPVVGIDTWEDINGIHYVSDGMRAIQTIEKIMNDV